MNVYNTFISNRNDLELIRVYETMLNSYVIELRVDSRMEVSEVSNTQAQNIILTTRWSALVCTNEILALIEKHDIFALSVRQVDQFGGEHSIAICN